jgi:flagellar FliL protein
MSNAAKPAAAPPKKGRRTLPLILGSIVVLALGGGGYWWWARQQVATAATSEHPGAEGDHGAASQTKNPEHAALLSLDSFTVNLADTEATRFLRTNVQLVLAVEEDVIKELEHEKLPIMRARSAVLELLAQQKSTALTTPEGKDALKKAIAERASKALHHEVSDVLFSDFVIQF